MTGNNPNSLTAPKGSRFAPKSEEIVAVVAATTLFCATTTGQLIENNFSHQIQYTTNSTTQMLYNEGQAIVIGSDTSMSLSEHNNAQLELIAQLEYDWNENEAEAFSQAHVNEARELASQLAPAPDFILPTARNSIQMEYDLENGGYLELELFEDGTLQKFTFTQEDGTNKEQIPLSSAAKVVRMFYAGKNR